MYVFGHKKCTCEVMEIEELLHQLWAIYESLSVRLLFVPVCSSESASCFALNQSGLFHVRTAIRRHSGAQFDMQHLCHHSPRCVVIRLVRYCAEVRPQAVIAMSARTHPSDVHPVVSFVVYGGLDGKFLYCRFEV